MKRIIVGVALIAFTIGAIARDHAAKPIRLVVLDAPRDFAAIATDLGYVAIEAVTFDSLDMQGYRLVVPPPQTVKSAIAALKDRFPFALVEIEGRFDVSALVQ